jgi:hypothetical protein
MKHNSLKFLAKKYEVTGLVDLCMEHFFFELKAKDSLRMLEYCLGKDEPVLRERSLQLIRGFSKEALESQAFLKASKAAVKEVYLQNSLSVSEMFLFKAVISN